MSSSRRACLDSAVSPHGLNTICTHLLLWEEADNTGSDLHSYRQTDPGVGFTIGHEVVSEVYEVGSAVKKFKVGDIVASPFASNCGMPFICQCAPLSICADLLGDCWYCSKGYTARCAQAQPFGSPALNGAQAEYVRQPLADAALFTIPPGVPEHLMLLLCDILPTGYSCAYHGRRLLDEDDDREMTSPMDGVAVVIGCGPVSPSLPLWPGSL
jgi:threonine dehydrogenase-like Zn-dependent dehydrogenase